MTGGSPLQPADRSSLAPETVTLLEFTVTDMQALFVDLIGQ